MNDAVDLHGLSIDHRVKIATLSEVYGTVAPALIMVTLLVTAAALAAAHWQTPADQALLGLAIASGVTRLIIVAWGRRQLQRQITDASAFAQLETAFARSYLFFAIVLGLFAVHNLAPSRPDSFPLIVCLLVGYAAGVALLVNLVPRLAVSAIVIAIVPSSLTLLCGATIYDRLTGVAMLAFMTGGIRALLRHSDTVRGEIGGRLATQLLAWRDPLTGLWNRRGLERWYADTAQQRLGQQAAIHVIDLVGFKKVNDLMGHQAGDDVLCAVAGRLTRTVRTDDFVVRTGGDEFLIVQLDVANEHDAQIMAERIDEAVSSTYRTRGDEATVGVTIGTHRFVIGDGDFESLVGQADDRLYRRRQELSAGAASS